MKTILVTGGMGAAGRRLRKSFRGKYALRVSDIVEPDELGPDEDYVRADLADMDAVARAVEGVDGIVHFGGFSVENSFEVILNSNIVGTYNVFEAARRAGVQRIVFPSSNQVVGFYSRDRRLTTASQIRPSSRYGVSKAFGEALAALYADKYGLRILIMRIGRTAPLPENLRGLSVWLSPDDLAQLVEIGLEHPDIHCDIVYGVSGNERGWYDNTRAFELGFRPKDNAEHHYAEALEGERNRKTPEDEVSRRFMGSGLCGLEFSGDLSRTGR